jgi:predicted nucleic acid-binding protein
VRFVDTSYWIALNNRRDADFLEAASLWVENSEDLVTTNHVGGGTWTFLNRRLGHAGACGFVDRIEGEPHLTVHRVDEEAVREAWAWLRRHDERVYSFVDATSFAMMRRLSITEALAFDGDFSAAGFVEVRP